MLHTYLEASLTWSHALSCSTSVWTIAIAPTSAVQYFRMQAPRAAKPLETFTTFTEMFTIVAQLFNSFAHLLVLNSHKYLYNCMSPCACVGGYDPELSRAGSTYCCNPVCTFAESCKSLLCEVECRAAVLHCGNFMIRCTLVKSQNCHQGTGSGDWREQRRKSDFQHSEKRIANQNWDMSNRQSRQCLLAFWE